jgi:hypothetical protein
MQIPVIFKGNEVRVSDVVFVIRVSPSTVLGLPNAIKCMQGVWVQCGVFVSQPASRYGKRMGSL